jgi:hypothetical protein
VAGLFLGAAPACVLHRVREEHPGFGPHGAALAIRAVLVFIHEIPNGSAKMPADLAASHSQNAWKFVRQAREKRRPLVKYKPVTDKRDYEPAVAMHSARDVLRR